MTRLASPSDGPEPTALPEMLVAELDDATFMALLRDVATHTTLLGVTVKAGATQHSAEHLEDSPSALVERHLSPWLAALDAGESERLPRGLQLRYEHGGLVVYDTLLRTADGWRLTRIAPPHAQTAG